MSTSTTDPVFDAEQAHLDATHKKLLEIQELTRQHLDESLREIQEYKGNIMDEVSIDAGGDDDVNMETYAQLALMNTVIDSFNLAIDSDKATLAKTEQLLPKPYFAKVILHFPEKDQDREIYFGSTGLTDERHRQLIVDWRAPVAETYYNQGNGAMTYEVNGRMIPVDLKLRRQFDITGATLNAYFDTTLAIEDPMLLESLAQQRGSQLQAITATIQREQNHVIRHADTPVLLVRGVAGSGKTSVMLQRIAYMLYRERTNLRAEQMVLITPNPVFERYIWDVLPQLGEKNPRTMRWDELIDTRGPGERDRGSDVTVETLRALEEGARQVQLELQDIRPLTAGDWTVLSQKQIVRTVDKLLARTPLSPRFFAQLEDSLLYQIDQRVKSLAKSSRFREAMLLLTGDEQEEIFGTVIQPDPDDTEALAEYARTYASWLVEPCRAAVGKTGWLRLDRIGMRILGVPSLSAVEWVWLNMVLTGMADESARHVMIDEVQDYTTAQLMVLARYYRKAHFLLLGDPNQAIRTGTASFDEIRELFGRAVGPVDECILGTSYRSAPEITALFARLANEDDGMQISSVRRSGEAPRIIVCPSAEEEPDAGRYLDALVQEIRSGVAQGGLTAVVVNTPRRQHWLEEQLEQRMGSPAGGGDAPRAMGHGRSLPEAGSVVLTLELAKGLEFDQVIIADAQASEFPVEAVPRRRLYTAISRATRRVSVLSQGPLTELLAGAVTDG